MKALQIVLLIFLFSCNNQPETEAVRFMGEAQGTYYSIIYFDDQQRDFQLEVDSILDAFDQSLSLWVPGSIISLVNEADTAIEIDEFFIDNFKIAREVAEKTKGAFDPTVGNLTRAWGFGFDASKNVDKHIIDSILEYTGYRKVHIKNNSFIKDDRRISIDFNAIAQGYSVDLIGNFIEEKGIDNYLVDIGGEVKAKGNKPDGTEWKVGIEKPAENKDDARDLKAVVRLKNKSIATSGNYRKFYEEDGIRYSHTINPANGFPVQHSLLSVSVLADNTAIADAYATAFMVMGLEKAINFISENPSLEAFFIYADDEGHYQTFMSEGFRAVITEEY
ncbi:MAG: FAD:protein FMN transferase [Bacteroidetes bacterium]|nr:FAD:protein FMN transferase [Bacteroidota bacterium]